MDIQTLYIIVASVALALALESIIFQQWSFKKIHRRLDALNEEISEMKQPKDDFRQLVNKLAAAPDFPEDIVELPAKKEIPAETVPAKDPQLQQAYNTFYTQYQQMVADISVDNISEKQQELATLLLEMGYWLKDFLPVWNEDFNATSTQKNNVASIAQSEQQWQKEIENAPKPTTNPIKTPFEAIALMRQLQQWGVKHFRLLISGFRYEPQNTES